MARMIRLVAMLGLGACAVDAPPKSAKPLVDSTKDSARAAALAPVVDTTIPDSVRRPQMPLMKVPSPMRGLYVNRWAAIGDRMWQLIDVAKRTETNTLVIDVKDDRGFVLYHSV